MDVSSSTFVIRHDSADAPRVVEFWSDTRLPFEPKGAAKDMRNALRDAVRLQVCADDSLLHASYRSAKLGFCDVENVLFYNVGTGSFANSSANGIRFERIFADVDPLEERSYDHYHRYEIQPRSVVFPTNWRRGVTLATWRALEIRPITSTTSASAVWLAMPPLLGADSRESTINDVSHFGLSLRIALPLTHSVSVNAIAKPLLDGLISACHAHDGSELSELVARLSEKLGAGPTVVEQRLMNPGFAVLGQRRLLHPFRNGVQWNPADDLCVVGEIIVDRDPALVGSWLVSGELFEAHAN